MNKSEALTLTNEPDPAPLLEMHLTMLRRQIEKVRWLRDHPEQLGGLPFPSQLSEDADAAEVLLGALNICRLGENAERAAYLAMMLGSAEATMNTRLFEAFGDRAVRNFLKMRRAHRDGEHSQEALDAAIAMFDRLMKERPERKKTGKCGAYAEVENETGIPGRTLREHLRKRREASA